MSLVADPRRLLSLIFDHRTAFPKAHAALPGLATKLTVEEIKSKPTDLAFLQTINRILGSKDFTLVLDAVSSPNIAKLVKHADKHNPFLKGAKPEWFRERYIYLVEGGAPFEKQTKLSKRNGSNSTKVNPPLQKATPKRETNPTKAKSTKAVWDGKNRDSEDLN